LGAVNAHLIELINKQIESNSIVVWFDPEKHYKEMAEEMEIPGVNIYCYNDSFFALRYDLEKLMKNTLPPKLIIYVPLAEEETHNALIGFTTTGVVMKPGQTPWQRNTRLSIVARNALKPLIGEEGAKSIEKNVEEGKLTLDELNKLAEKGEGLTGGGMLISLFGTNNPCEIAETFLKNEEMDQKIIDKDVMGELVILLEDAFGAELYENEIPEVNRANFARYLLMTSFSEEIKNIPHELKTVKTAMEEKHKKSCINHVETWRLKRDLQKSYVLWANGVEKELSLDKFTFNQEEIYSGKTFLFMEEKLQQAVEEKMIEKVTAELIKIAKEKQTEFWAEEKPEVQARWILICVTGELLEECCRINKELKKTEEHIEVLIKNYTETEKPWCHMDTLYRHMENLYRNFEFAPGDKHKNLEKLIIKGQQEYMKTGDKLAEFFVKTLKKSKYNIPDILKQRNIYEKLVEPELKRGKTAYVLVDSLRFEMARELLEGLTEEFDINLIPATGTVPTITETGMAALMPVKNKELKLVETGKGKIGFEIEGKIIKDKKSRIKFLEENAGVPVYNVDLEALVPKPKGKTETSIKEAGLILLTSGEIDKLCEGDKIALARLTMDKILVELRRACRKLKDLGVKTIIITADHGHLFGEELESDMKINPPGGNTIDLHRRVWVGKGGEEHPSILRFTASDFGLGGELEMAVPYGFGVFTVPGGGRAYFHGGLSPQELIIPVAKLKTRDREEKVGGEIKWILTLGSKNISTRFCSVAIQGESESLFDIIPTKVRVEIRAGSEIISQPISATYGFESSTGDIQLKLENEGNKKIEVNTVALMINKEFEEKTVNIYMMDEITGRELSRIENIPVVISI